LNTSVKFFTFWNPQNIFTFKTETNQILILIYILINQELKIFFAALTFFTRLPSPYSYDNFDEGLLNRSARYFPLVGWIVGGICAFIVWLSVQFLPHSVSIILSMGIGVMVTGAFHEDGFADSCDGFGGGWTKERILEIMKDSRIGSYGTIGILLMLLFKYLLLSEMPIHLLPLIIIAGHSVSRFASTHTIYTHNYVGNSASSKAKPLCSEITSKEMFVAFIFGLVPLCLLNNYRLFFTLIPVIITKWWLTRYFNKWIGGYTGDCLGAIQQVTEVVFYLSALVLYKNFL
jgi:adenosylcobinamide-GDP ribazoletransferase